MFLSIDIMESLALSRDIKKILFHSMNISRDII